MGRERVEDQKGPAPESKLARIEARLNQPDVVLIDRAIKTHVPLDASIYEDVNFLVAPTADLYDPKALNKFATGLSDLQRSESSSAYFEREDFYFPTRVYIEVIGTYTREPGSVRVKIPEREVDHTYSLGESKEMESRRKIGLKVFPSAQIARLVLACEEATKKGLKLDDDVLQGLLWRHPHLPVSVIESLQRGEDPFGELREKYPFLFDR